MTGQQTQTPRQRGAWWQSSLMAIVGLIVFVAVVVGLDAALKPRLTGTALILVGVLLAIIPAVIWLVFFYLQDRLEPEPKKEVVKIFIVGLALAGAIGIPLTYQVFHVQEWLYRGTVPLVLASFFIVGAIEAFIVYAAVRFFIYDSPEFDERTDGMVYATAAGLGYATALNVQFILSSGGVALGAAEIVVAEVALAHAAFAGVLGYFLGRAKMERETIWWLPMGLILATALNGLFNIVRVQIEVGTVTVGTASPLPSLGGLILAGVMAIGVALVVAYLINRDIARTISGQQPTPTGDPTVGDRQSNHAVLASFAVMLVIGIIAWATVTGSTTAFDKDGFKGAYPAYFGQATTPDDVLRVADTLGTGAEFAVQTVTLESGQDDRRVASLLAAQRGTDHDAYRVLSYAQARVDGKPALAQRFAYVDTQQLKKVLPRVIEGIDYIVVDGNRAVIITLVTTPDDLPEVEPLFGRFVDRLTF